jgi:hypothetical protein
LEDGLTVRANLQSRWLTRHPWPPNLFGNFLELQTNDTMKKILLSVFAALALLSSTGCTTIADAKAAKGTGTVRVYDKPYDVVWDAVVSSIKSTSLALVSEDRTGGTILAQGAVSAFSWGENVAIYVEDAGGKVKTRVEIINKRAMATNVTAANWETRLSAAIDQRIAAMPK